MKNVTLHKFSSGLIWALALAGCDSGSNTGSDPMNPDMAMQPVGSFTIGGNVSGLMGTGLVLQLNGAGDLPVSASGAFSFPGKISTGSSYAVTVKTQPSNPTQMCTVMSGSGAVGNANVSNVSVVCSTTAFKVGGTVTGLSGTVVLQNNAGDDLSVSQSGAFNFNTLVAVGASYAVTVKDHPAGQICSVAMGTGMVSNAEITDVAVTCGIPQTCKEIKTAIPAATDGDYTVDPDGAGALPSIKVFCDMTTDGGGYTMYGVTGGISTINKDQANSCTAIGLKMIIPRTKAHLSAMWKKYGASYFQTVPGIYGKAAGNYTGCAMNSGDAVCSANWVALDGGAWYVRDTAYSEPNGDYTAGVWLGVTGPLDAQGNGTLTFNDLTGGYPTGGSYVCSDNAK
jgi:hypothetical protein